GVFYYYSNSRGGTWFSQETIVPLVNGNVASTASITADASGTISILTYRDYITGELYTKKVSDPSWTLSQQFVDPVGVTKYSYGTYHDKKFRYNFEFPITFIYISGVGMRLYGKYSPAAPDIFVGV